MSDSNPQKQPGPLPQSLQNPIATQGAPQQVPVSVTDQLKAAEAQMRQQYQSLLTDLEKGLKDGTPELQAEARKLKEEITAKKQKLDSNLNNSPEPIPQKNFEKELADKIGLNFG